MSDEWTKTRDEAADDILETKLMPIFRQSNMSAQAKGVVKETARIGFDLGAAFGRDYELKRTAKLERDLEIESEAHTFYKQEWEYACERYNSMKLNHEDAERKCETLEAEIVALNKRIIQVNGFLHQSAMACKRLEAAIRNARQCLPDELARPCGYLDEALNKTQGEGE